MNQDSLVTAYTQGSGVDETDTGIGTQLYFFDKDGHGKQYFLFQFHKTVIGNLTWKKVVTIVCNFTLPLEGQPALLSPDEAKTLFHEFGHALHTLFRDVHYYGVSNVPRDFVDFLHR